VGVLEKIGLLFDFGDGLLSYRSFERLLLKVFRNEVRGSSNRRRQAASGDGDGSPFSDTLDGRGGGGGEEDDGKKTGFLSHLCIKMHDFTKTRSGQT
jgi:hypothetical protein